MKKLWLLLFTTPITIFTLVWSINVLDGFSDLQKLQKNPTKLHEQGILSFYKITHSLERMFFGKTYTADVNIYIKPQDLSAINKNTFNSVFSYKKAFMEINGEFYKGKIKPRGANSNHWNNKYKSWRFSSKKTQLINGVRKYNFINLKKDKLLNNHLSYKTAELMDLISPSSTIVSFSINNEEDTLKLMLEQIDESFLRKNRIMPVDIYKDDAFGIGSFNVENVNLFKNPSLWSKASINNHYSDSNKLPLENILAGIHSGNHEHFDIASFANFSAYTDIIGTQHFDTFHNWMMYYDTYKEKMTPIVWDPVGYHFSDRNSLNIFHMITSPLFESLHKDYNFIRKKHQILLNFYSNQDTEYTTMIDEEFNKLEEKIQEVGFNVNDEMKYFSRKQSSSILKTFREDILYFHNDKKIRFMSPANPAHYKYSYTNGNIRLSVNGDKLINRIEINVLSKQLSSKPTISYLNNGITYKNKVFPEYNNENNSIIINTNLLSNMQIITLFESPNAYVKSLDVSEATYDFHVTNTNNIKSIALTFANGERMTIGKTNHINQTSFNGALNIIEETPSHDKLIWTGNIELSGFTLINQDLTIKPGTTITLNKGATIKVLGKVQALGTLNNPIIIKSKDKNTPWGAFTLQGPKANGSTFRHCFFSGGSGDKGNLYEYTAMLSIHNVSNLLIDNCEFSDSKRTDDMVHMVYSKAIIRNSKFINSNLDALDVDMSSITITGSQFIDSGNDAVDLMGSKAIISNTTFSHSVDKGISIGEESHLFSTNNFFSNNGIAVQSKDSSLAYIYNTTFDSNKQAVHAYHKNWRYSRGGMIFVDSSTFKLNNSYFSASKKSRIVINNCNLPRSHLTPYDLKSTKHLLFSEAEIETTSLEFPIYKTKEQFIRAVKY